MAQGAPGCGGSVCTGEQYIVSTQKPYRLGKAWIFDGGLRVPFIARWPGTIEAGSVSGALSINTDIYPTVLGP